ncbi:MAG: aspartate 1-decarboxylase [Alphaproteobacteria bacterium]|jgi:aspartate 1-decarboxylase|nr:aspartate 1-decarboxylase [Alphaproteobacteria bacterium]
MLRTFLRAKLHRARVTSAELDYEGSIAIDAALLTASGIAAFEQVDVYNITNGARFTTYAILGKPGEVSVKGAAARLVQTGDLLIVACFGLLDEKDLSAGFSPKVVLLDGNSNTVLGT